MTAQIAGFVSRTDWGARPPRSVSRNIDAARGGLAVHYGGASGPPADHEGCVARWRSWQAYHLDGRGWADIAYSFGFCDHGYVLAGRGLGIRTAANGTNDGNDRFLAACWVGGGDATPSPAAYDALDWITAEVRRNGAGREVRPHRYFKSTGCPGVALVARAGQLHGTDIGAPTPAPAAPVRPAPATGPAPSSEEYDMDTLDLSNAHRQLVTGRHVDNLQGLLLAAGYGPDGLVDRSGRPDGKAGAATRAALGAWQKRTNTGDGRGNPDYICGKNSWRTLIEH